MSFPWISVEGSYGLLPSPDEKESPRATYVSVGLEPTLIRPIELFAPLVNHSAPSGPAVMSIGSEMVGSV